MCLLYQLRFGCDSISTKLVACDDLKEGAKQRVPGKQWCKDVAWADYALKYKKKCPNCLEVEEEVAELTDRVAEEYHGYPINSAERVKGFEKIMRIDDDMYTGNIVPYHRENATRFLKLMEEVPLIKEETQTGSQRMKAAN